MTVTDPGLEARMDDGVTPVRQRMTLPIDGLTCGGGGALSVERVIARLAGVSRVYVNPATEMAYIEFAPSRCTPADVSRAVERAGFRVGTLSRF
jgi:copper chaperone CopZ